MVEEIQRDMGFSFSEPSREVVKHLIFHKSLIDEGKSGERINDYLYMIDNMDNSVYYISQDPFECAIASLFKLVIDEKMNPWDIDLVSFSKMYLGEAKEKENLNFTVAGHLVRMAWSILKMQCEEVLHNAEEDKEEEYVEEEPIWNWEMFDDGFYQDPDDIEYEENVLEGDGFKLEKAVRREEKRPVSLMELVDAFEKGKKEAQYREKMERLRRERAEERKKLISQRGENFDTKAHKEDMQKDIKIIWKRICWYKQKLLEFDMLHDGRKSDFITAFTSVLFLHKDGKIKLKQDKLPYGQIMLKALVPLDKVERNHALEILEEELEETTLEKMVTF
ncbi:MAG: hypothetical protein R6U17_08875 [Thermoplasmata archaeon]